MKYFERGETTQRGHSCGFWLTVDHLSKWSQLTEEAVGWVLPGVLKHQQELTGRDPSPSAACRVGDGGAGHARLWQWTPQGAGNVHWPRRRADSRLPHPHPPPGAPDWVLPNRQAPARPRPGKVAEFSTGCPVLAQYLKQASFVLETTDFRSDAKKKADLRLRSLRSWAWTWWVLL